MKTLNLKDWKDELHEAKMTGVEEIVITPNELSRFIEEIESLRNRLMTVNIDEGASRW